MLGLRERTHTYVFGNGVCFDDIIKVSFYNRLVSLLRLGLQLGEQTGQAVRNGKASYHY